MNTQSPSAVSATKLKEWAHDGKELALLDVREHGQYGEEHLFYVVSVPYSRLELEVQRLVPRKNVRLVMVGDESGALSNKVYQRLKAIGYSDIYALEGGMPAWRNVGLEVFAGVNLPSKAFGELAEHAFHTPSISAAELNEKILKKEDIVILDGRPFNEFKKMSIPTAMCCPNGELPLRIDDIVKNPDTTIVVNCAGRTRSIIGAQTLINLGIPNKVVALENGTQGWYLQDFELNHGKTSRHPMQVNPADLATRQQRARTLAEQHGVKFVKGTQVEQWMTDNTRTTFLCDVRTPEEYAQGTIPGAQHTPGGQLVQATDQYVGTKGARLVLIDAEGVRAPAMASWLAMLGWDIAVCDDAFSHQWKQQPARPLLPNNIPAGVAAVAVKEIAKLIEDQAVVLDLRPSMKYRESHLKAARWSIRPQFPSLATEVAGRKVLLLVDEPEVATMAALDLQEMGAATVVMNADGPQAWSAAGLPMETTPELPPNAECIDYLFFVHDRHDGNKAAARQYLAWEINLLKQLDDKERAAFRLPH